MPRRRVSRQPSWIAWAVGVLLAVAVSVGPGCKRPAPRDRGGAAKAPALIAMDVDLSGSFDTHLSAARESLRNLALKGVRLGDVVVLVAFYGYDPPQTPVLFSRKISSEDDLRELVAQIDGLVTQADAAGTDPVAGLNRLVEEVQQVAGGESLSSRLWLLCTDAYADAGASGRAPLSQANLSDFTDQDELCFLFYDNSRDSDLVRQLTSQHLRFSVDSPGMSAARLEQITARLSTRGPQIAIDGGAPPPGSAGGAPRPLAALALLASVGLLLGALLSLRHKVAVDEMARLLRVFPAETMRLVGPDCAGHASDVEVPVRELTGRVMAELSSRWFAVEARCPDSQASLSVNGTPVPHPLETGANELAYARLEEGLPVNYTAPVELSDFTELNQTKLVMLYVGVVGTLAAGGWMIWLAVRGAA